MPQPIFPQALVDKAAPFSSFQYWMGTKATDLIEDEGKLTGVLRVRRLDPVATLHPHAPLASRPWLSADHRV